MNAARTARTAGPVAGTALLAALLLAVLAPLARASQFSYPPGPQDCCPDTLTILNLQDPNAVPHPVKGDIVLGVGGIVTAFDPKGVPFGFYMQMSNGWPYSGVGVFTGNTDVGPGTPTNLQLGDSVVVYGKVQGFQGAVSIGSPTGGNEVATTVDGGSNTVIIRVVSHGNPQPPVHTGTTAEFAYPTSNPLAGRWDGMVVHLPGPLRVVAAHPSALDLDDDENLTNDFLVVSAACTGGPCDTVFVDGNTLTTVPAPPPGTILAGLSGVMDLREEGYRIQLRGPGDFVAGVPPLATDAFPVYDNDLLGTSRIDSVEVVFDRPVEKTSAETIANYALASLGTVDGARRLDAPEDNRVVLQLHNGRNDGDPEALTVSGVASLADGTPMLAPQTFAFRNGVLELAEVQAPDPAALAADPCDDRSRYDGPGGAPGQRVSFTGIVTGVFGNLVTLQDAAGIRHGLWVDTGAFALTPGHAWLLAGALEEFQGETRGVGLTYARDLGPAASPDPLVESVNVLADLTCDALQLFLTGRDFDGVLVTVPRALVLTSAGPGGSFWIGAPGGAVPAGAARTGAAALAGGGVQLEVVAAGGNFSSFTAAAGEVATITGVLGEVNGAFAIFPRSDADLQGFGSTPTFTVPLDASKSATASRDPDVVLAAGGALFLGWDRNFHESVHSLSLDQGDNWSLALPIAHQGIQPALAVTPSNRIGVLASGVDSLVFKVSTDGGIQMDAPVFAVDVGPTQYPALACGAGEHLHAAWERPGSGLYYARSLDGGAAFSTPVALVSDTLDHVNSMVRVAASKGDSVVAVWQYHAPGEPPVDKVLYSRSLDGGQTWSAPRRVRDESNPLNSTIKLQFLGDAQVGPDGVFYVMGLQYGDGQTDSVAFLKSTDGGATFDLVGHVTNPAPAGLCPKSFCVAPDGVTIHALVGICGTALYYAKSPDGGATWGPTVNVTSASSAAVGEPRGAKIILDGEGKPVIVWYAPVGGSTEIYSTRLLN